ncbi:LLM class flavin-dependent oxidoreductase [Streptomyces sp. NPDC056690]|uniref:LLM class flavin-dependent oxidoreductase n=1 Tax=unclassified Streptomyces TaxID=2593676 RepID=UPI0036359C96
MILGTAAHPFRPFKDWIRVVHLVEELGYGMTCQSANPLSRGDAYVELGVAARETKHLLLATTVAVPAPANPAVMAASIATVNQISDGRAVLGMGRGTATARMIGERGLTTAGLEEYVTAVRALLAGHEVDWHETPLRLGWLDREPPPVILAAYGPKTLRMAGRCADGVLIASAVRGRVLREAIRTVRTAAREAGRDPAELAIWVMGRASVGDDADESLGDLKAILAGAGRQLDERDPDLGEDLRPALAELKNRYVEADHVVPGGANDALIDELGLVDYLAGRFAITGTPKECRDQLQELADLGVDCVFLNGAMRNEERMIVSMADRVGVSFQAKADLAESATP